MTDIEDNKHEARTTRGWLMEMLERHKDPIASVSRQIARTRPVGAYHASMQRALQALILAAVPLEEDTQEQARMKRSFVRKASQRHKGGRHAK